MSKRRKRITWSVALAVVVAGGAFAYHRYGDAQADTVAFKTQPVTRGRVVQSVTATGTLSPLKTVQVGSQVSGRVLELHADFNSVVKQGQLLARIDPQLFQSEIQKAKANLSAARANVVKARAALDDARQTDARNQSLAARGLIAQSEADASAAAVKNAVASLTGASAALSQAEATVDQSKINLDYTSIYSPIDGVVISRNVDVGQTVAASMSAPTLFTIAEDMRAMEVHTSVAESDVGSLADDMAVEFAVDAFPGARFAGKVTQIRNAPVTVQNVVTYDAVVRVDNAELKLRPGMTANVTFIVARRDNVLTVPSAALRFTPAGLEAPRVRQRPEGAARPEGATRGEGGWRNRNRSGSAMRARPRTVWVLEGGKPKAVQVSIGISDGALTEITGGDLAEGAVVITGAAGQSAAAPAQQQGGARRGGARGPLGF